MKTGPAALAAAQARAGLPRRSDCHFPAAAHRRIELQTEQSKVDAEGRVRQAEAELAAAEAELAQQEASYQIALFDNDAIPKLVKTGAASERQGKQAASTADQQAAAVAAAKTARRSARGRADHGAGKSLESRHPRSFQSATVGSRSTQQQARSPALQANIEQARFNWPRPRTNRSDLTVTRALRRHRDHARRRARRSGHGRHRHRHPARSEQGLSARLRSRRADRQGKDRSAGARLSRFATRSSRSTPTFSRIDPQATFTPENTYFRDDRVKQVVGVKLQLKGAIGFAKPGMPADGEILVQGEPGQTQQSSK